MNSHEKAKPPEVGRRLPRAFFVSPDYALSLPQLTLLVKKSTHRVLQPLILLAIRRGDAAILRELAALNRKWGARR